MLVESRSRTSSRASTAAMPLCFALVSPLLGSAASCCVEGRAQAAAARPPADVVSRLVVSAINHGVPVEDSVTAVESARRLAGARRPSRASTS